MPGKVRPATRRAWKEANRERLRKQDRAWRAAHQEQVRAAQTRYRGRNLKARRAATAKHHRTPEARQRARELRWLHEYGLTAEQVESLLQEQGGVCAICGRPLTISKMGLRVDHDHETAAVRGLLCHKCNVGLGHFDDSPERLLAAVVYLDRARRRKLA